MRLHSAKVLPLALSLVLIACGKDATTPSEPDGPDGRVPPTIAWSDATYETYSYRFHWTCYCLETFLRTVDITVSDRVVQRVVDVKTGSVLDAQMASHFRTIEGLNAFLEDAKERRANTIRVTYEPTLGYPKFAWVDYDVDVADEEMGFEILWVRPE